jgi:hypothetical protein
VAGPELTSASSPEPIQFCAAPQQRGSVEEVVARCAGIIIARAAYKAARTQYPNRLVMLCRQAQVVERSDEDH